MTYEIKNISRGTLFYIGDICEEEFGMDDEQIDELIISVENSCLSKDQIDTMESLADLASLADNCFSGFGYDSVAEEIRDLIS